MSNFGQTDRPESSVADKLRRHPQEAAWELDTLLDERRQETVDGLSSLISSQDLSIGLVFKEYLRGLRLRAEADAPADPRIILTSGSPRRRRIVRLILQSDDFSIEPVLVEETEPTGAQPAIRVLVIAIQKMLAFVRTHRHDLSGKEVVIAADTLICSETGQTQGKYEGVADPLQKLISLVADANPGCVQGRTLKACTGVVVLNVCTKSLDWTVAEADIVFHSLDHTLGPEEIRVLREICADPQYAEAKALLTFGSVKVRSLLETYITSKKHEGKAGGFNIEDRDFFLCVKSVQGDPFTIIGLPYHETRRLLARNGVKTSATADLKAIWHHEAERRKVHARGDDDDNSQ